MLLPFLLALAQAATQKPIESLPPLVPGAQAVSPDHKRIAVSTHGEGVWVLDIATRSLAFRVAPTGSVVEYVSWSQPPVNGPDSGSETPRWRAKGPSCAHGEAGTSIIGLTVPADAHNPDWKR